MSQKVLIRNRVPAPLDKLSYCALFCDWFIVELVLLTYNFSEEYQFWPAAQQETKEVFFGAIDKLLDKRREFDSLLLRFNEAASNKQWDEVLQVRRSI